MPGGTRSQNPQLEDPLTPSRERPRRPTQPTSRAQFLQKQKETNNKEKEQAKRKEVIDNAPTSGEHPQSKKARERRAEKAKEDARLAVARDLRDEEEQRKIEAWEKEVETYGEEEAILRRIVVRKVRKEKEQLTTSDIEEEEEEEAAANPLVHLQLLMRVDKVTRYNSALKDWYLQELEALSLDEALNELMEKAGGTKEGWELQRIVCWVKANHSRAKRVPQEIDEFTIGEWEKVAALIRTESARWKYEIDVKIETTFTATRKKGEQDIRKYTKPIIPKRSYEALSSDPVIPAEDDEIQESTPKATVPPPKKRLHRTDKLIEASRERAKSSMAAGHFERALVDRWQCNDEDCTNNKEHKGYCFLDYKKKHYAIDISQHIRWAKAMERGDPDVSIETPPKDIYENWVGTQGPVTYNSRRSKVHQERQEAKSDRDESKSFMQEYREFQQEQMRIKMMKQMDAEIAPTNPTSNMLQQPIYLPYQMPYNPAPPPPQWSQPPWQQWQPSPWQLVPFQSNRIGLAVARKISHAFIE